MRTFFQLFILLLYAQNSLRLQILPRDKNYTDVTIHPFLQELKTAAIEKDTGKLSQLADHKEPACF